MFLARVPTIWLGLLLAAVAGRWAGEMAAGWGVARPVARAGGFIALALLAFDPNILAHTRLATTDLGLAAVAALAGYVLWRFLRRPAWPAAALAGVGLGLLQNTKFTALLFLPLFGLVILMAFWQWRGEGRRRLAQRALLVLVLYPIVALLTLWATNGFQVGKLSSPLPVIGGLGGAVVPLSHYLDQLLDIGGRLQVGTPAFLLGQYSDSGWWYYFPVAFVVKTPLATLLLLGYSSLRIVMSAKRTVARSGHPGTLNPNDSPPHKKSSRALDLCALLIPALGFFGIALTTDINLGYRHLLPVLPFLAVFIGAVVGEALGEGRSHGLGGRAARVLAPAALLWLLVATLVIYPHFISFFNLLAGGPDNGWRVLVDSNIDWGQDLERLAHWLNENEVNRVWLSYFGEGRPEYYGISYDGLDSFPPRLMNPNARPFYPHDPAPGWYAISATTLQGVHFAEHDLLRTFRDRAPDDKVGYSIFLYEQPARGQAVDLLLSNVQLDVIAPEAYARLATNDTRPRWFDGARAVIVPDGVRPVWLAAAGDGIHPLLQPYLVEDAPRAVAGNGYRLGRVTPRSPAEERRPLSLDGDVISFAGAPHVDLGLTQIAVLTAWRQESPPRPVKLFVHLLDESGAIVTQWDGLDAAWEGWRPGDTLVQVSTLPLPATLTAGQYRLTTGLYDPETNQRWRLPDGQDVVELTQFTIP